MNNHLMIEIQIKLDKDIEDVREYKYLKHEIEINGGN